METDLPTAALRSSQATHAAVDKSPSTSHTKIQTLPILDKLEHVKASIRAKVEHPFRVIKRQFGYVKVRYRGLAKNTAQLYTLFALSNLWMVRRTLLKEAWG
ncbi:MAG: Mobile element protein [Burkholderiaceae bacterium]|jgi:IS5 family transposase|nr:MAG: Mobile element protein [Burkholderiaceae bacterium]